MLWQGLHIILHLHEKKITPLIFFNLWLKLPIGEAGLPRRLSLGRIVQCSSPGSNILCVCQGGQWFKQSLSSSWCLISSKSSSIFLRHPFAHSLCVFLHTFYFLLTNSLIPYLDHKINLIVILIWIISLQDLSIIAIMPTWRRNTNTLTHG